MIIILKISLTTITTTQFQCPCSPGKLTRGHFLTLNINPGGHLSTLKIENQVVVIIQQYEKDFA